MCGIAGFVGFRSGEDSVRSTMRAMLDRLVHRGPDDEGIWADKDVALGHRRLAIVDLSPSGHQPMQSVSGRYVIVFNGEIYNHGSLRKELEKRGIAFAGNSDTEVLLGLIDQFGVAAALGRVIGMFAFAVWDKRLRCLVLVRDRMGEKPLYYGWHGRSFLFGSELKALHAHPAFVGRIDREVLPHFLRFGFVPSPRSIFTNTYKLGPAEMLILQLPAGLSGSVVPDRCELTIQKFWRYRPHTFGDAPTATHQKFPEAVDQLDKLLNDAVRLQMQADVPLGAFLSGGVDSSTIVALMQKQSVRPIKTFCVGYGEKEVNEAPYAKAVAQHLGTDHAEFCVTARDALDVIPKLPQMYDEPLADSSQIPTYLVAALARKSVTVSLSGDGGDELFLGYRKYGMGSTIAHVPGRRLLGLLIKTLPLNAIRTLGNVLPTKIARGIDALEYIAPLLRVPRLSELANQLSALNRDSDSLLPTPSEGGGTHSDVDVAREFYLEFAAAMDMDSYLPDDILVKVDRAAMAVSLETRAPFLDHRVVEFAYQLPREYKLDNSGGKRILREVVQRYIPRHLIERRKMGFSIPLLTWLQSDLREWAESLIEGDGVAEFLNVQRVRTMWDEVLRGQRANEHGFWAVLTFAAWYEQHAKSSVSVSDFL